MIITVYVTNRNTTSSDSEYEFEELMRRNKVEYQVMSVKKTTEQMRALLSEPINKMRKRGKTGKFIDLAKLPIVETQKSAWNRDELNKMNKEELMKILEIVKKEQSEKRTKLRITKITKSTSSGIDLSVKSLARINVTITRVINGQDINKIMSNWSDEEKAAGIIMWRLAQHQNAITMEIFAEMLNDKAKTIDPWRK